MHKSDSLKLVKDCVEMLGNMTSDQGCWYLLEMAGQAEDNYEHIYNRLGDPDCNLIWAGKG